MNEAKYMTEGETANRVERIETDMANLRQEVSEVTGAVGKIEVSVGSLVNAVKDQNDTIRSIAARQNERRDTNWFGLLGAVFGGVSVLGAFILLHVSPIRDQVTDHHRRLEITTERDMRQAVDSARQAETLRWLEKDYDRRASP